jgi:hypothetical protein
MSADRPAIDEPRYLTVIPLIIRIAATYFAVVAVALVADLLIVQGATFRTWPAFGAQAVLTLVLGWFVVRPTWIGSGPRSTATRSTGARSRSAIR